jgi:hypothetical protein
MQTNGLEEASITVVATVTAFGRKLSLLFPAAGFTGRVHEIQIGNLNRAAFDGQHFHLICDQLAAHKTTEVMAAAEKLGIEMHFTRASCIDELQPHDGRAFGILKAKAKALFHRDLGTDLGSLLAKSRELNRAKKQAAQDLMAAWGDLTFEQIPAGWDIHDSTIDHIEVLLDSSSNGTLVQYPKQLRSSQLITKSVPIE